MPGFEDADLVSQSHRGVRETRRIIGDYVITIDDLHNRVRFDDVVAKNCRGLDYHLKGTIFTYTGLQGHHDISLRALLPQGVENLTVCGRSVSCDHASQASLRCAVICMATGHAAGTTAALAAMGNGRMRDLDVRQVQAKLVEQDAVIWLWAAAVKNRLRARKTKRRIRNHTCQPQSRSASSAQGARYSPWPWSRISA